MRNYVVKSTIGRIYQKIDVSELRVITKNLLIYLGLIFGTLLAAFSLVKILWIGEDYE
jgi:hypothetical protein